MQQSNKTVLENMVPSVRIIYPDDGEIIFEEGNYLPTLPLK